MRWIAPCLMGLKVGAGFALSLVLGGGSLAQTASPSLSDVTVRIGLALAAKAPKLGQTDVDEIAKDLTDTVRAELRSHHARAPVRADLVLEDATPNRPTPEQLRDHPSLSMRSVALGGASISGVVTFADGRTEPLSYNFRQVSLQYELGATPWSDAELAFDMLGDALGNGRIPHDRLDIRLADSGFDR